MGLLGFFLFASTVSQAQKQDTSSFHFQVPFGIQQMVSSSLKPYQRNFSFGLSGMVRTKVKNWSFDWGLSSGFQTGTNNEPASEETGIHYSPLFTASETLTVYAGLGQRWTTPKRLFQCGGGISYRYAEFTPAGTSATEYRNFLGAYLRGAMQFRLSPSALAGPFATWHFYPTNSTGNFQLNVTSVSVGLSIGPSF